VVADGKVLGKTPFQRQFPRSATPITVEFRRSGFRPQPREFVPDAEKRVSTSLEKIPRTPAASKPAAAKPSGKSGGKPGAGGKSGGKTGSSTTRTSPAPDKPPTKPPVKFVP
jgi:hypothetical protein